MREIAIDSIAQPAQQWNRPSSCTSTWVGKLENGWHLRIAGWFVVWSRVRTSPRSSSR